MKQRIQHYDILSGVMLLFMMHHHVCDTCGLMNAPIHSIPYKVLYFYIAYFFYKAGCFYNPQKSIYTVIKESSKRLLVPFVLFTAIGYAFFGATEPITTWHYWGYPIRQVFAIGRVEGNGPLWFLLSLFIVRVVFQTSKGTCWKQIVWIIIGACVGMIGHHYGFRPRTISNVGMGVFFYGMGYMLRNIQYEKWVGTASILIFAALYMIMFFCGWHVVDFSLNKVDYGIHPIWLINCVIACVALHYMLQKYSWQYSPLAWIGKHSMTFLCAHALVYEFLHKFVYTHISISSYMQLCFDWIGIMIICSTLVYVFRNKHLCWIIGEKKPC